MKGLLPAAVVVVLLAPSAAALVGSHVGVGASCALVDNDECSFSWPTYGALWTNARVWRYEYVGTFDGLWGIDIVGDRPYSVRCEGSLDGAILANGESLSLLGGFEGFCWRVHAFVPPRSGDVEFHAITQGTGTLEISFEA